MWGYLLYSSLPYTHIKHTHTHVSLENILDESVKINSSNLNLWAHTFSICEVNNLWAHTYSICEVKWALGSITTNKASGGDGIPVELFQILKDDAVNWCTQYAQQIWKTLQWLQDWKRSVFIPIPKKANAKQHSNYCTIALILHASNVMLKILQIRLQQYISQELPDVQVGVKKGRGTRDQIVNISWIMEKSKRAEEKYLLLFHWLCQSLWLCRSQQTGKFLRRW